MQEGNQGHLQSVTKQQQPKEGDARCGAGSRTTVDAVATGNKLGGGTIGQTETRWHRGEGTLAPWRD